jgi:hypothetical protein
MATELQKKKLHGYFIEEKVATVLTVSESSFRGYHPGSYPNRLYEGKERQYEKSNRKAAFFYTQKLIMFAF